MWWLFVANALFSACYLAYAIADVVVMWGRHLVHPYGLNEWGVSADSQELKRWMDKSRYILFWLQMVSMSPVLWHLALAFLLHEFLVRGRSPGALERQLRTTGWKLMLGAFVAIVSLEAGVVYGKHTRALDDPKVRKGGGGVGGEGWVIGCLRGNGGGGGGGSVGGGP
jgi:uncharacterized membrane protein YgcG